MLNLRYIVVAVVLIVSPLVVLGGSVVFGRQRADAHLLFATHVTEPAKLLRIVERTVTFTQEDNKRAIGAIVIDDINHTIGGEASILDGGPTSTYVTLKFKSMRGQGLDFNVYIYDSP
ncbi:probable salivary secreted peptide [Drosophila guanche]|uniref:Salivary secreted peptide n=1 Tax=Drosophila guanche TaxID=7266 RepID=A0A3B0JT21_DROGU|nr:probable salivary secreted peptide [Drosophila guanche]SPP83552.1 Hypothetical predicted protein [Drosophila guanche]